MGYSYSSRNGRMSLDCDSCGEGPARKYRCPFTVSYADGGSLPYCQAPALCSTCRPKYATVAAHRAQGCEEGARRSQAREADKAAKALTGVYEVITAFGDWHEKVPAGMVGVIATPGALRDPASYAARRFYLLTLADYQAGGRYTIPPDAAPWADPL